MSTMERVPGQLEVSQHVQKICAPLIILSSQYLLSNIFTIIKVYVQRLAHLRKLLWCHSCLWGWTGRPAIKMNKMSWSQTVWTENNHQKNICRWSRPTGLFFLLPAAFSETCFSSLSRLTVTHPPLKYFPRTKSKINTAWTVLQEKKTMTDLIQFGTKSNYLKEKQ